MTDEALTPIPAARWDTHTARHLLRRAGFGIPAARVEALAAMSPEAAVDSLLDFPDSTLSAPGFVLPPVSRAARRDAMRLLTDEERGAVVMERNRQERLAIRLLKGWWLERMVTTPDPLEEKLTLMWHGHFATSANKVSSSWANWDLHQTLRRHAAGNLRELTTAVGQSPAMLRYLDNDQSSREHPNENWSRELLELFTLGQGAYSEQDIQEAARAFTGWTTDEARFIFLRRQHDNGPKTFLGQRGRFDGHDIIGIIFEQPACARHFAARLWSYFGSEAPDEAIIASLADTLRAHDYELRPALRALFLAERFYADAVVGSQVKSPAQLAVQLVHDLHLDPMPAHTMALATARLGQDLFNPPTVKGWDGNSAWVNANSMLLRVNLPGALITAGPRERRVAGREMTAMMEPEGGMASREAMMEKMAGSAAEGVLAEGAAAAREAALTTALAQFPTEARARIRGRIEAASSPDEQYAILEQALRRRGQQQPWRPAAMLDGIGRNTAADEALDRLIERYLAVPLAAEQRALLVRAMGVTDGAGTLRDAGPRGIRAALHLLLSTAEYQLC